MPLFCESRIRRLVAQIARRPRPVKHPPSDGLGRWIAASERMPPAGLTVDAWHSERGRCFDRRWLDMQRFQRDADGPGRVTHWRELPRSETWAGWLDEPAEESGAPIFRECA